MPAVFDRNYVRRLEGSNVKSAKSKWDAVLEVREDIQRFKADNGVERLVMIWCGSTEVFMQHHEVHDEIESLEKAIQENHPAIPPSMIYAYAALQEGVPFLNGAPNLTVDVPAMVELARQKGVPIGGKDFKTGQTLMKTLLAPGLKARMLGVQGWFSTNILGNRDGRSARRPRFVQRPRKSANSTCWSSSCSPTSTPNSTAIFTIKYGSTTILRAATRRRVGTTSTSSAGWACPCRSRSISSAAIRFSPRRWCWIWCCLPIWRSARRWRGIQEWLSFYFKSPMTAPDLYPEHDLFIQLMKLKNTLRFLQGEDLITHLGQEYYD